MLQALKPNTCRCAHEESGAQGEQDGLRWCGSSRWHQLRPRLSLLATSIGLTWKQQPILGPSPFLFSTRPTGHHGGQAIRVSNRALCALSPGLPLVVRADPTGRNTGTPRASLVELAGGIVSGQRRPFDINQVDPGLWSRPSSTDG